MLLEILIRKTLHWNYGCLLKLLWPPSLLEKFLEIFIVLDILGSRQMLPVAKLFIQSRWLDTLVKSSMIIWWYDMIWYDTWHILQAENRDWMANYIHYLYSTIAGSPQWGWHGRSCHKRPWGRQGSRLWNPSDTWRGRCRWCWRSLCQDSSTCTFCIYRLSLRSL